MGGCGDRDQVQLLTGHRDKASDADQDAARGVGATGDPHARRHGRQRPAGTLELLGVDLDVVRNTVALQHVLQPLSVADVQDVLQKAAIVNGFMTRNRLNVQTQNDWTSVRTELNSLATAYGVSSQWSQQTPPPMSSNRSARLSENELNQLIQRIENGGDTARIANHQFERWPRLPNVEGHRNDSRAHRTEENLDILAAVSD